ncbi:hypothetical protein N9H75_04490 [Amylibacter sp.]|nr:hypothetical protein [Amylibacter sp.]
MADTDDREQYLENCKNKSSNLGLDNKIFQQPKDLIYNLDQYVKI